MSIFCTNCGASIPEGKKFCTGCGSKMEDMAAAPQPAMAGVGSQPAPMTQQAYSPAYAPPPPAFHAPQPQAVSGEQPFGEPPPKGSPYALISAWGYVGYFLLMGIPLIGLILTFVWAFEKSGSLSRRNLARAMLLFMGLSLLFAILSMVMLWPVITQVVDISFS